MAVWVLTGTSHREHIYLALHELQWLPVEYQIRFTALAVTFKALNGLWPVYLQDHFSWYTPQTALYTGGKNLLVVPSWRDVWLSSTRARALFALAFFW